jgi:hypothetical protein
MDGTHETAQPHRSASTRINRAIALLYDERRQLAERFNMVNRAIAALEEKRQAIAPARPGMSRPSRPPVTQPGSATAKVATIRSWARAQGLQVSSSGPLPTRVLQAWEAVSKANPATAPTSTD